MTNKETYICPFRLYALTPGQQVGEIVKCPIKHKHGYECPLHMTGKGESSDRCAFVDIALALRNKKHTE